MQNSNRSEELSEKVHSWLTEQGVDYIREAQVDLLGVRIDFLVLRPQPVAFELRMKAPGLPFSNYQRMARRMLTQRIAIGDEFGPHVPYVLILPAPESEGRPEDLSIPFVDGVLTTDSLPDWKSLPEHIDFDRRAQNILRHSTTRNDSQIEEEAAVDRWSRSLSLESLVFSQSPYPQDTLAGWLQEFIHEKIEASRNGDFNRRLEGKGHESKEKLLRKTSFQLEPVIADYVVEKLKGQSVHKHDSVGSGAGPEVQVSLDGWKGPNDTLFAIRSIRGDAHLIRTRKAREIVATGAILRTLYPISSGGLVLLYEGGSRKTGTAVNDGVSQTTVDTLTINRLVQSGWRVFPWDFAEPEPEFVRYLREQVDK